MTEAGTPRSMLAKSGVAWAIIPAGGTGSRFSSQSNKLLALVADVPVLVRSVRAVLAAKCIQQVVLVCHPDLKSEYQAVLTQWLPEAPILYVAGGATRRDSVCQGLMSVPAEVPVVAVHDAARPLISTPVIEQAVHTVLEGVPGALVAVPIQDTVKQVVPDSLMIQGTLDRRLLWRAQTPQCFDRALLLQAHQQVASDIPVTDDVQLVELAGLGPVMVVPGDERNLKITTLTDLHMAEALLAAMGPDLL